MKILVLDNYDSFVYNLVHMLKELGYSPTIVRNDKISLEDVKAYDKILLSPGPGIPSEAGIMPQLIKEYSPSKSILGICLGHQAIGEAFGEELYNLPEVLHGLSSTLHIQNQESKLFKGLAQNLKIGHYHSWVVKHFEESESLLIDAIDERGNIMAVSHKNFDVNALQFHPESILTENGMDMIKNWLST